ncbi:DUF4178 domain-containing protein [Sphaerospermopsis aphanizomenoides BCCUSP55]|uniref:DUF4178 domain-containing protein n=1 Tax=Sphaerospermopsis aphanizomenoides TaxID=459663 RepID=UPI001905EC18|nr:DUF4178 domain-containing protein [Sphaerospermopsis aphanizomenoides]MBK1986609.1 DUF4178 domain-containing protein [Sphaerospermopsis aphanizomenoides BCCUSP55]
MYTVDIETQLHALRPGDRVRYSGVDWDIKDYSTYQDPQGYQTDEWLLVSSGGSEYYLLREHDPNEEENSVAWYISNQLENVTLYLPDSKEELIPLTRLWQEMQALNTPYPELKLFYKSYYFESQTEGDYDSQGKVKSRITWDYWDKEHLINLAIEALPNLQLDIYSTKKVQLQDFNKIQKGVGSQRRLWNFAPGLIIEMIIALAFLSIGILLMLFG